MVAQTAPSPTIAPTSSESGAGVNVDSAMDKPADASGKADKGFDKLTPDKAVDQSDAPAVKRRTGGWKFFDAVVYGGINFGGNVASAFWIANKMYDKEMLGQKFSGVGKLLVPFYAVGQFAKNNIFGPFFHHNLKEKPANQMTGMFSAVIALSWGGTLMLAPVKLLEDHKPKIVRAIDKAFDKIRGVFGGGPDAKELAERDETYKLLDSQQVKKTWGQAIRARLFSVGVGVLGGLGLLILFDPKHKGIDHLASGYTNSIAPKMRAKNIFPGMAPVPAPEMSQIEALQDSTDFILSKGLQPASDAAKALLKSMNVSNAEANFLHKLGMDPASDDARSKLVDIYTRNKSAWNVSNLAVELSGSAITAGIFYVKMMFKELFGQDEKSAAPVASAPAKASSDTTKALTDAALANNAETPAHGKDTQAVAQKKFTDTITKREEPKIEARPAAARSESFSRDGLAAGVEKARTETAMAAAIS